MSPRAAVLRPAPPRRSQAERSAGTRTRLLEATADSLAQLGYARTTTTEVCRRAGVSQGALFKHFPTKLELMSRTAEHVFAALRADYRQAFVALTEEVDRISAAVRGLWAIFHQPRLQAAFELYIAARTDAELLTALRPVVERHAALVRELARDLFPEAAAANPNFEAVIHTAVYAMQGAAMAGPAARDDERDAQLLVFLTKLGHAALRVRT